MHIAHGIESQVLQNKFSAKSAVKQIGSHADSHKYQGGTHERIDFTDYLIDW